MKNITLESWNINGIEFEAVIKSEDERYVAGFVANPAFDGFTFAPESFEDSELEQLVEEGYLVKCEPYWIIPGFFCVRISPKFPNDEEEATCEVCHVSFNWKNDGSQLVQTFAGSGPSYACGGEPPEFEPACSSCVGGE